MNCGSRSGSRASPIAGQPADIVHVHFQQRFRGYACLRRPGGAAHGRPAATPAPRNGPPTSPAPTFRSPTFSLRRPSNPTDGDRTPPSRRWQPICPGRTRCSRWARRWLGRQDRSWPTRSRGLRRGPRGGAAGPRRAGGPIRRRRSDAQRSRAARPAQIRAWNRQEGQGSSRTGVVESSFLSHRPSRHDPDRRPAGPAPVDPTADLAAHRPPEPPVVDRAASQRGAADGVSAASGVRLGAPAGDAGAGRRCRNGWPPTSASADIAFIAGSGDRASGPSLASPDLPPGTPTSPAMRTATCWSCPMPAATTWPIWWSC
jgi:hypothetical protein